MKKALTRLLTAAAVGFLLISAVACAEFAPSSGRFDPALAQDALQISELCHMPSMQEAVLALDDYRRVGLFNAERPEDDARHVATYSVFDRKADGGKTEVIIAVRGTGDGEWKLNMELMPSGDYDLPYAENFALAADDILQTQSEYLASLESPVFLVTGHSRGAAVANILGARLTDRYGAENVFVYTFATPRTVRGVVPEYTNIFNVINPADIVTYLPFPQWGFERYGTDVELPVENAALIGKAQSAYESRKDQTGGFISPEGRSETARRIAAVLASLAPQVRDGFTVRHALLHPGEAAEGEQGMTAGEFMQALIEQNLSLSSGGSRAVEAFSKISNDFTPVIKELTALLTADDSGWILSMHMPATYGAWISVLP